MIHDFAGLGQPKITDRVSHREPNMTHMWSCGCNLLYRWATPQQPAMCSGAHRWLLCLQKFFRQQSTKFPRDTRIHGRWTHQDAPRISQGNGIRMPRGHLECCATSFFRWGSRPCNLSGSLAEHRRVRTWVMCASTVAEKDCDDRCSGQCEYVKLGVRARRRRLSRGPARGNHSMFEL